MNAKSACELSRRTRLESTKSVAVLNYKSNYTTSTVTSVDNFYCSSLWLSVITDLLDDVMGVELMRRCGCKLVLCYMGRS